MKKDGKMILRRMLPTFEAAVSEYAVVVVYGPRQSGKTTLSQIGCKNFNYANLEDKETRELAQNDYKAFFRRFPAPLIIGEVQRLPELLAQVQVIVDGNGKEPGQFVLTGSQLVYDGEMLSGLGASGVTARNIREFSNTDI